MATEEIIKTEKGNLINLYKAFYAHTEEEYNEKKEQGIEYVEVRQNLYCPTIYRYDFTADFDRVESIDSVWRNFISELTQVQQAEDLCRYFDEPEYEKDLRLIGLMFEDYRDLQSVRDMNIFKTLKSVQLLENDFNRDYSNPKRSASAIHTLLNSLDSYIKSKIIIQLVRRNHYSAGAVRNWPEEEKVKWNEAKAQYNLELLEPEGNV